jgi:hypothetical protein
MHVRTQGGEDVIAGAVAFTAIKTLLPLLSTSQLKQLEAIVSDAM